MTDVISGDPARLEDYTRATKPMVSLARAAAEDAAEAIARFNRAPNDLNSTVSTHETDRALEHLGQLDVLDDQPEAFAWALRQADQHGGGGPVTFTGDWMLFNALVSARLDNRFMSDEEILAQALRNRGVPAEDASVLAAMLGVAEREGWANELREFLFGDLGNYWGGDDGSMPWGASAAALLRATRARGYLSQWLTAVRLGERLPDAPTSANGAIARLLGRMLPAIERLRASTLISGLEAARGQNLFARGQSLRSLPARAGLVRGLGVVGGVYSTVDGIAGLVEQGNPIEAFRENPTEYAADVAQTAFSASSTAFLVAPNPVTAGATIVTGVAWVGLEAWNHREEIADVAGDVASFLNPFD